MALVFLIFEPPKEIDRGGTCAGYGLRGRRLSERRGADQGGSGLGRLLKIRGEGKEDSGRGKRGVLGTYLHSPRWPESDKSGDLVTVAARTSDEQEQEETRTR